MGDPDPDPLTPAYMRKPKELPPPPLEYKGHPTVSKCVYCKQKCKNREALVETCPHFIQDPDKKWSRRDRQRIKKRMKIIDELPEIEFRPPPPSAPGSRHTKEGREAYEKWLQEQAARRRNSG